MARPLREVAHLGEVVEDLLQGSIDLSIGFSKRWRVQLVELTGQSMAS
jgi:hypothetical protein